MDKVCQQVMAMLVQECLHETQVKTFPGLIRITCCRHKTTHLSMMCHSGEHCV